MDKIFIKGKCVKHKLYGCQDCIVEYKKQSNKKWLNKQNEIKLCVQNYNNFVARSKITLDLNHNEDY